MGCYIAQALIKRMIQKRIQVDDANILIMGLTFKENCPDLRNSRVIDIIEELQSYGANIHVYDPWVNEQEAKQEYNIELVANLKKKYYDTIVVAVAHQQFYEMKIQAFAKANSVIYDVKSVLPNDVVDGRL